MKLLEIPVSVLPKLNMLIIIYLHDMLLIGSTIEETLIARDRVIILLQQLGFASLDIYTENRVLSGDSRLINHEPVSTGEESVESSEAVSRTSSEISSVNFSLMLKRLLPSTV